MRESMLQYELPYFVYIWAHCIIPLDMGQNNFLTPGFLSSTARIYFATGPRQSCFLSALPSRAADQWAFTHLNEPSVCLRAYDCAGTLILCKHTKHSISLHNYEVKTMPIIYG